MDIRNERRSLGNYDPLPDDAYQEPGLGAWIRRNTWLLTRLFIVLVFTFSASTTAANFSYGLQGTPTVLTVEQLNAGELPAGIALGDYVEVTGTPDYAVNPETGQPKIGVSARYSAAYYYYRLEETGDNLIVQQAQTPPDIADIAQRPLRGKIATVGTVIFHDTTQDGLDAAGLPRDENIPVIETGDTPEYYRQIFPAYSAILGLWLLSIAWLAWKRNKPILGM